MCRFSVAAFSNVEMIYLLKLCMLKCLRSKYRRAEIVKPISVDAVYGFRSFYVMGPDKVLTEIVEEKPLPEGLWD